MSAPPDHAELTRRLADLIVRLGMNVQPGQVVGITSYTGKEDLARAIAGAAYDAGAFYVDAMILDQWVKRARLDLAPEEALTYVPPWMVSRLEWHAEVMAARVSLVGPSEPAALDGVDPARAGLDQLPYLPNSSRVTNSGRTNWCVAPAPSRGWAELVYPDLPPDEAYHRLWQAVAHMCRLDEPDPIEAWRRRGAELQAVGRRLDDARFDAIHLRGPGTDLTVGLLPSSTWEGGGSARIDGLKHFSNIPTEEVFTAPDPARVDGVVTATKPLERYGTFHEGIRVEFREGRAVRIDATKGEQALRAVAARDDGASRLGEIALVDGSGRIGPLDTIFFETLVDENSASHIALGSGYLKTVSDPGDEARVNRSEIHVDFMIGRPDMEVDGITRDGTAVPVLRGGVWQL